MKIYIYIIFVSEWLAVTADISDTSDSKPQNLTLNLSWTDDSSQQQNIILNLQKNPVHNHRIPLFGKDETSDRTVQTDLLNLKVGG